MKAKAPRKCRPVWQQEQMLDGSPSWRLYVGPRRQWSAEVHATPAGYAIFYVMKQARGAPWFTHCYAVIESAMVAAESIVLPERLRRDAAQFRRNMLQDASVPPEIIARAPVWLMRHHDNGTVRLYGGGYEGWVHRWGSDRWRWIVVADTPLSGGIVRTRRDGMIAVEQALRLSGHERLHAWNVLYEHLAQLRALTRENVHRGR